MADQHTHLLQLQVKGRPIRVGDLVTWVSATRPKGQLRKLGKPRSMRFFGRVSAVNAEQEVLVCRTKSGKHVARVPLRIATRVLEGEEAEAAVASAPKLPEPPRPSDFQFQPINPPAP